MGFLGRTLLLQIANTYVVRGRPEGFKKVGWRGEERRGECEEGGREGGKETEGEEEERRRSRK